MAKKKLNTALALANKQNRRLVVPLLGFPGLQITGSTIKLAQQNYNEHFKVLKALVETFSPDLIFPLMDLSVEANALGSYTVFPQQDSATVIKGEVSEKDLRRIDSINIECDSRVISYVETIRLIKSTLPQNILCGAYVTGPYTLASLLIGAEEAAITTIMDEDYLHKLCSLAFKKINDYIKLLVDAGAEIICILEPSAVILSPDRFTEFSGNYVKRICDEYADSQISFVYHICGNTMNLINEMSESGVSALSLDSEMAGVNIFEVLDKIKSETIIIGNVSPIGNLLNGTPEMVQNEVNDLLTQTGKFPNYVLSTGCDLPQETPIENIKAFMDAGRNFKTDFL